MRLRRNRITTIYHRKQETVKDAEGCTIEEYGTATALKGEIWPAGGRIQAEQYGEKLDYIRNLRLSGKYEITATDKRTVYTLSTGAEISEGDGLCLYVNGDTDPDYRIISIKPYRFLTIEVEKVNK